MKNRFFLPVFSEFLTKDELQDIITANANFLNDIAVEQISEKNFLVENSVCYFIATGGTEQQVLAWQKKRKSKFASEKVVLLAHASHNSLPACLEILAKLQQDETKGKIIYLPEASATLLKDHKPAIRILENNLFLKGSRIGLIGAPSDWLVASSPSVNTIFNTWGAEVVEINLSEVVELMRSITANEIIDIKYDFASKANSVLEPENNEIDDNVRVYLALKKLVIKYNLNALTIRCFDLVIDLKTTGCFALSRLNDEGIIAGCEGDLNSTIGMMWAHKTFGKLPWMANPSQLNLIENTLWLAHCTVPCSLVTDYKIRSHFESGLGVGIQGEFPEQKVYLIRIGGKNLEKIWQVKGEIVQTGNNKNLCRTQIKVKLGDNYNIQDLLTNPLGNHLVVVGS